jgi:hypothetical protein
MSKALQVLSFKPLTTSLPNCGAEVALERTKVLLGSYANAKPHDPRRYTAAVAAVLTQYPLEVVARATDPRDPDSAQRKHPKWLPEPGEVAEVCDAIAVQINARAYAEQRRQVEEDKREQERIQRLEYMRVRPEVERRIQEWRASVGPLESPVKGWRGLGGMPTKIVGTDPKAKDHPHADEDQDQAR